MTEFDLVIERDAEDADVAEVLVDGTVGGRPYCVLLDMGAAKTGVTRDEYTSAFVPISQSRSAGVFAGVRDDVIVVPSVGVGRLVKHDWEVTRSAGRGGHDRPLIGMDFLKDHRCEFLFGAGRVILDGDGAPGAAPAEQELFLDRTFHPYVDVAFGDVTARTVWDTGAGITIADLAFIGRNPALFRETTRAQGTDAGGNQRDTPLFVMAASVIGGHPFPATKVAGVDLSRANAGLDVPMDLILGYTTLSQADWLFDFPRRRWAILKGLGPAG